MASGRRAKGVVVSQGQNMDSGPVEAVKRQELGIGVLFESLSEREFQRIVVDGLKQRGYRVWIVPDMRMTAAGLPDIIALHPDARRPLLLWELKTERGRIRPEQSAVIRDLQGRPGVDARILRPSMWSALSKEV